MENRKSLLFGKNIFAETFHQFNEESFFQRLEGKIKPQPYFHKYKGFKNTILLLSYVFNLASMLSASYAVFWLTKWITGAAWAAYIVGAVFLFFLEKIKRKSSNELFQLYFFQREISQSWLMLSVFCFAISLLSSGFGTKTGTEQLSPDPELLATDSMATTYRAEVAGLVKENEELEKQRDQKGTIYYRLQSVIKNNKMMIVDYNNRILELDKKMEGKNDLLVTGYQNQVHQIAWILVVLTIIVELLFEFCIAYIWYFYHRSYIERKTVGGTPKSNLPNPQKPNSEALKELFKQLQTEEMPPQNDNEPSNGPSNYRGSNSKMQNHLSLPIGFYSSKQRKEQSKNMFKQEIQVFKQPFSENEPINQDRHTIAHRDFKNDEIKHLNIGNINNRIGIYIQKIQKAFENDNFRVVPNQLSKLQYWINRRNELLKKLTNDC